MRCWLGRCAAIIFLDRVGWGEGPGRGYRSWEARPPGGRRLADRPGGILPVLRLHRRADVGCRDSELGHFVGVEPQPHGINLRGAETRFADAREAPELIDEGDLRVIGEEQRVEPVVTS